MFHTGTVSKILKEKCGEALQRECNNKREYPLVLNDSLSIISKVFEECSLF